MGILQRVQALRNELPNTVCFIGVTKSASVDQIRAAYNAGLRDFGESRVQDAQNKILQLKDCQDVRWHLIGSLQANKVRSALKLFSWIHSVDELDLARRIDRIAEELGVCPNILLQVKLLPDPGKKGFSLESLLEALPQLDLLEHVRIRGLMTIAPYGLTPSEQYSLFSRVKALAQELKNQAWQHLSMDDLSMGMSGDYPQAVAAGATMVRIGRHIFAPEQEGNEATRLEASGQVQFSSIQEPTL
ncbi:MAG: YggS family pyridoxal phosphate-dependent enzyme [Gloeobacterales cyanobacterium]